MTEYIIPTKQDDTAVQAKQPDTFDFSNFDRFQVAETREYDYRDLADAEGNSPTFIIACAGGTGNKPYTAELTASIGKIASKSEMQKLLSQAGGKAENLTPEQIATMTRLAADRKEEMYGIYRSLFAKHVIKDWRGIKDATGRVVPCNPANVADVLALIPDHILDKLISFAQKVENFENRNLPNFEEAKSLGESSPSA